MANKEKLLRDVYKYFSVCSADEDIAQEKQRLRQEKIDKKGVLIEQKLFRDILACTKDYAVVDWTDKDACCYELKILLHKNQEILDDDTILMKVLGGIRRDLRVFISVLEPYYYSFVEETKYIEKTNQWSFKKIEMRTKRTDDVIIILHNCLAQNGYEELLDSDVKTVVADIETELSELTKTTIFDCLFTDVVSLF